VKKYKTLNVSNKIALVTLITSVSAVLLMLVGVFFYEKLTYQSQAVSKLESNANSIASEVSALVVNAEPLLLQQSLPLLSGISDIQKVVVFDTNRKQIAQFNTHAVNSSENTAKFELQLLQNEKWVGDIEISFQIKPFSEQLEKYYLTGLFSLMALIVMLILQRFFFGRVLVTPLSGLMDILQISGEELQRKDEKDEFKILASTFEEVRLQAMQHQQDLKLVTEDLKTRSVQLEHELEERQQAEKRLSFISRHDVLTGLPNRAAFDLLLDELLEDAHLDNHTHVLMYMDIDQFKVINDTCGHVAGDHLLRQITEVLRKDIRQEDTLARLGGDEFGVLLPYCGTKIALNIANKMRQTIMNFRFTWQDKSFSIGISIGMVPITPDSETRESLLSLADALCYTAKENGRNCVEVYQGDKQGKTNRQTEMYWVSRVNDAMEENRIVLMYQPIQAITHDEHRDHYEILMRLQETSGELIAPGAFLSAAERYNLMPRLDRYVVRSTFEWLNFHPGHLDNLGMCSINLSGSSLGDTDFLEFIIDGLSRFKIPPEKICFEITETMAVQTFNHTVTFMEKLKRLGCKFALDDFGSGFSSYAYLKNLPVDFLKIDGAFVRDIADDKLDRSMVKSINEIAHVMGKKTIAEYVESPEILSFLYEIGVDYAQGVYIGKPEPLDNILLNVELKQG